MRQTARTPEVRRLTSQLKELLAAEKRLSFGLDDPLPIKRFLRTGELESTISGRVNTLPSCLGELYRELGDLLDESNANEILGEIVFEGVDGKFYVVTVEACIGEASPEYLADSRREIGESE